MADPVWEKNDDDDDVVEAAVEDSFSTLVVDVVLAVVLVEVGVVDLALGVVVVAAALEVVVDFDPPPPFPPPLPASKRTMFAVAPDGTVTTQKFAPPAPEDESELVTTLSPFVGSILQGSPLHSTPSAQVISIPKVGSVLERSHPVKIGFQASFRKVSPLATVFPPAT